jgi:hypothetical protein
VAIRSFGDLYLKHFVTMGYSGFQHQRMVVIHIFFPVSFMHAGRSTRAFLELATAPFPLLGPSDVMPSRTSQHRPCQSSFKHDFEQQHLSKLQRHPQGRGCLVSVSVALAQLCFRKAARMVSTDSVAFHFLDLSLNSGWQVTGLENRLHLHLDVLNSGLSRN